MILVILELEKATPFDFDMEIAMLEYNLADIFGDDFVKQPDVQDMLTDFRVNKADFARLWDTINYSVWQNIEESG